MYSYAPPSWRNVRSLLFKEAIRTIPGARLYFFVNMLQHALHSAWQAKFNLTRWIYSDKNLSRQR